MLSYPPMLDKSLHLRQKNRMCILSWKLLRYNFKSCLICRHQISLWREKKNRKKKKINKRQMSGLENRETVLWAESYRYLCMQKTIPNCTLRHHSVWSHLKILQREFLTMMTAATQPIISSSQSSKSNKLVLWVFCLNSYANNHISALLMLTGANKVLWTNKII